VILLRFHAAMVKNNRIHQIPALHATAGGKIHMAGVIQHIDTPLGDHQSPAPGTPGRADDPVPPVHIRFRELFRNQSGHHCHGRTASLQHVPSPNRVRTRSNAARSAT
jgi:hypothetical protein